MYIEKESGKLKVNEKIGIKRMAEDKDNGDSDGEDDQNKVLSKNKKLKMKSVIGQKELDVGHFIIHSGKEYKGRGGGDAIKKGSRQAPHAYIKMNPKMAGNRHKTDNSLSSILKQGGALKGIKYSK